MTRASAPTATRRWSPASRRRCARPTGSTPQIAAGLSYTPPSFNAFDRVTDVDTPLRSYQDLGGASLNVDWKLGPGRLTSTTRLALLGLESVERSRLHRPAGHHDLGRAVEAAAMDAGSPLRRGRVAPPELRRRRVRVPPDASTRIRSSSRNRAPRRRRFCWRRARTRRRPACSTATATTSTVNYGNTSAAAVRPAAMVGHRSPARCCPACGSTTTRRTSTSTSRSTAACRRPIPR